MIFSILVCLRITSYFQELKKYDLKNKKDEIIRRIWNSLNVSVKQKGSSITLVDSECLVLYNVPSIDQRLQIREIGIICDQKFEEKQVSDDILAVSRKIIKSTGNVESAKNLDHLINHVFSNSDLLFQFKDEEISGAPVFNLKKEGNYWKLQSGGEHSEWLTIDCHPLKIISGDPSIPPFHRFILQIKYTGKDKDIETFLKKVQEDCADPLVIWESGKVLGDLLRLLEELNQITTLEEKLKKVSQYSSTIYHVSDALLIKIPAIAYFLPRYWENELQFSNR